MLPRSQRLSAGQFAEVMEKGRMVHSSLFTLRFYEAGLAEQTMVSAVAPQKIAKTAVLRNKTRRRIYEAVKPMFLSIKPHTKAIVFAKAAALNADLKAMSDDIRQLFVKAKLLK